MLQWTSKTTKYFPRKHDVILFYSKTEKTGFNYDAVRIRHKRQKVSGGVGMAAGKRTLVEVQIAEAEQIKKGKLCPDWWNDIGAGSHMSKIERVGYPTQKPLALLERIIQASSQTGDIVLDPFCGCATTCVAAEDLQRQWIGVDISIKAYELVNERLTKEVADPNDLLKQQNTIHLKTDPPRRTDLGNDYQETKFVYVISHPEYPGEYKVGIAKNWKSRLNAYQTSDPNRQYKVEFTHQTPLFRETEKYIHNLFPNKHEWVQGDLATIIQSIKSYKPGE